MPAAPKTCQHCGKSISAKVRHGVCPECLMKVGLAKDTAVPAGDFETPLPPQPRFVPPKSSELADHFPQLEIVEMIGRGGMGAVYRARQKQLNRQVALKILPTETGGNRAFAERFTREARALAQLNHPNIIAVHDFGQSGGYYYFIMEFIDGVNLRQLLQEERLSPEQTLAIVPQICVALQYAHDQGVVHRDIKPENILMDKEARVKIADFGLAKLMVRDPQEQRLTQSREVMGTPHYMAPEQLEKPLEVDHRADLYSLGVVFYELLTGELPLGKFDPPSHKARSDTRLDAIVLRALQKNPERRFQHASEVKTAVETVATTPPPVRSENPPISETESGDVPELETTAKRAKRNGIMAGLGAAILLLCIIGLGTDFWKRPKLVFPPKPVSNKAIQLKARIPPRDPSAGSNLVDLTEYYNAALGDNWHDPLDRENHLGELPAGLQVLAGTRFDVRGLIQVKEPSNRYPPRVGGITVKQTCQRLHFLHAAINAAFLADGQEIGRYIVHYAGGEQREIPIVTGRDVVDWYKQSEGACVIAWTGENPKSRKSNIKVRLFKSSWVNPLPDIEILTMDLVGTHPGGPAPFLVAITAE